MWQSSKGDMGWGLTSGVKMGEGEKAPMPPVLGPVLPSPTAL